MSKFIDILKRGTQATPAPMGFGRTLSQEKPRMLLVAEIPKADIPDIKKNIAGADAGLLVVENLKSGMESLQKLNRDLPGIPWGGWLTDGSWGKSDIPSINADFIVFPAAMPIFKMPAELGKLLEIDSGITDGILRAVGELPVDAVLIGDKPEKLNWQSLVDIQRIDNMVSKYLLLRVRNDINTAELETLWKVGVDGVVIDISSVQTGRLQELRDMVNKASFPLPRKSRKLEATLPFITAETPAAADEEEEEDDE